jgi:hypothetical protein
MIMVSFLFSIRKRHHQPSLIAAINRHQPLPPDSGVALAA